jgi:RNA polymerase sigma factor (sigma-70 family)
MVCSTIELDAVQIEERDPFFWLAPKRAADEASRHEYAQRVLKNLASFFANKGCTVPEDLASESLLRLMRKLGDGEPEVQDSQESRIQYLFGIARNVLREWRRKPEAREAELEPLEEQFPLPAIDLIRIECQELFVKVVHEVLEGLEPEAREILRERHLNPGVPSTLADLAARNQKTPAAMRKQAQRARLRFHAAISASFRFGDLMRCLGIEGNTL